MNKHDCKQNAFYMIYLIRCVLQGKIPSKEKLAKMDMQQLFEYAQSQSLTAMTAYALESAGVEDAAFEEAKNKAICKNILFDAERANILSRFEDEGIWYIPLKGVIMKDLYPQLGMRQMSDNDILYDGSFRETARDIMLSLDYESAQFGAHKDDAYYKQPVYNFELHSELFNKRNFHLFYSYYESVKDRLIKDEDNSFGYHFTKEDFYIYMIAHEYSHYSLGGTGIRSLVDSYIYISRYNNVLDYDYITREFEKLGIADYEKQSRSLAFKVLEGKKLDEAEKAQLDYYIFSGTYGSFKNSVNNGIKKHGKGSKARYMLYRVFPPLEFYKESVPWAYKHKVLLPVGWLYRVFRGLVINRRSFLGEIKILGKK